jgi:hypothetical protein
MGKRPLGLGETRLFKSAKLVPRRKPSKSATPVSEKVSEKKTIMLSRMPSRTAQSTPFAKQMPSNIINLLGKKEEYIKDFGCQFKVFRKRTHSHIVSFSVWKANPKYLFTMTNAMAWWGKNFRKFYRERQWGIRLFLDENIFTERFGKSKSEKDIDWEILLTHLAKKPFVELWFYSCPAGKHGKDVHQDTFGSILRFQPFFDKSVEVTLSRNVEWGETKTNMEFVKKWLKSGKKVHHYLLYGYKFSNVYYKERAKELFESKTSSADGSMDVNVYPAGLFAFRGTMSRKKYKFLFEYLNKPDKGILKYGVDEIILYKLASSFSSSGNVFYTYVISTNILQALICSVGIQVALVAFIKKYGGKIRSLVDRKAISENSMESKKSDSSLSTPSSELYEKDFDQIYFMFANLDVPGIFKFLKRAMNRILKIKVSDTIKPSPKYFSIQHHMSKMKVSSILNNCVVIEEFPLYGLKLKSSFDIGTMKQIYARYKKRFSEIYGNSNQTTVKLHEFNNLVSYEGKIIKQCRYMKRHYYNLSRSESSSNSTMTESIDSL